MRKRLNRGNRRRQPVRVALAVALAATLLAGIAFASGLLDSVFMMMKGRYVTEDVDYEAIHQAAAKDVFEQQVELPGIDEPMRFTINESYYDGESIMLGLLYTLPHRPASFDFGPDHEFFSQLEPEEGLADRLHRELTEWEYQQYQNQLKQRGSAGVVVYDAYISDGVYGDNGEELQLAIDDDNMLPDGSQWRMVSVDQALPDALRNRDEIGVQFIAALRVTYYYEDQSGIRAFVPPEPLAAVPLAARIQRSSVETRRYEREVAHASYSVSVEALVAPAYVKAVFTLDVPGEWREAARDEFNFSAGASPVDFICDFIMVGHGTVDEDGEVIESGTDTMKTDLFEMSGTYPPPFEGEDTLIFRPVYVNSGPHPDEDIVIDIGK